ncbi:hypothetical protein Plav_2496 [Parvibaculum lavamentivorans DS-1]|uniref:Uncharacterized protein n=1 Tax=Parvibaculum lavamentivorans (strain DS-1 / DSM 13023 / NCIMB 13966) TaxID=402881 RepID=A7HW22_PARL1|nr:hypothetical protein [Parvibaculum lavamentivorans]ABS64105.1 hypothetical protein Plav_2496 [Parvibaculum lavamentivorans DS-1]
MDTVAALIGQISQAPYALRGGIYWLVFINSASLLFVFTRMMEARWIFAASLCSIALFGLAFDFSGFTALLAAVHFSVWAPLLIWLVWRNPVDGVREAWSFYMVLMFTSNLVALGFDVAGLYHWTEADRLPA